MGYCRYLSIVGNKCDIPVTIASSSGLCTTVFDKSKATAMGNAHGAMVIAKFPDD